MTFQVTDSMPPTNWPPVGGDLRTPQPELLRLVAVGSPWAIQNYIQSMHHFGYADPNDWSRLMPTGRPGEMMAILTKRLIREE